MGNTLKKKKGFSMPHVYAVILILMLLVTIMTYVIPAGTYARVDGNVDPNSFTYVEQTPVSFLSFFYLSSPGLCGERQCDRSRAAHQRCHPDHPEDRCLSPPVFRPSSSGPRAGVW